MKPLLVLLVLTAGCAAFEPPRIHAGETRCLVGDCTTLAGTMADLKDPDFLARVNAARPGEPR